MQILNILYTLTIGLLVIFSYAFVDPNFPLRSPIITKLTNIDNVTKTWLYISAIGLFYVIYLLTLLKLKNPKITIRAVWLLIFVNVLLLLSYPAFSFDIFNYIATAKVTFLYGENPYVVMPIELSREPLLSFMHAANKTALYGPSWIFLTAIPFFVGANNLFATVFTFKLFTVLFYVGTCYLIFLLSKRDKIKLAFFALNPLVIIETLVSGHNDIVMVFFALLAFYLIGKKLYILSVGAIVISILIKFATIFMVPIFLYVFYLSIKRKETNWNKIWFCCFIAMLFVFLLSPIREEIYSWYFIWPISFLALTNNKYMFKWVAVVVSAGLLLRFAPFIYTREWGGITPLVKLLVTVGSLILGLVSYPIVKKKIL